jgi:hypothetical protein
VIFLLVYNQPRLVVDGLDSDGPGGMVAFVPFLDSSIGIDEEAKIILRAYLS